VLLSMLSDGVFFFSANRVDIRFVTGKLIIFEKKGKSYWV